MHTPLRILGFLAPLAFALAASAQATKPAPAPAADAVVINLADPQVALGSFFAAQKANKLDDLQKTVATTVAAKKAYVVDCLTYQMWARYLERQAIAKFGQDDGITVQGHLRSLDDQTDLDLKRVREAGVEYNAARTAATIFLRVERNRPDNLRIDTFQFLDTYYLVKTPAGWQVDYLKTVKRFDPDSDESYKAEVGAFPRMSRNLKVLAEALKSGHYKTSDDLKNALDTLWTKVYDQPTDASGQTEAEAAAAAAATAPASKEAPPAVPDSSATKPAEK